MSNKFPNQSATDVISWLRVHGHQAVARDIIRLTKKWAKQGKHTRRNWWDVLAGTQVGRPRRVEDVVFPVLREAQRRQFQQRKARIDANARREETYSLQRERSTVRRAI